MTEQEHRDRVQAWLDEAGDEPTPFGKAVIEVCRRRGIDSPEWLRMADHHEVALRDHCDGVKDAVRPMYLPTAVAHAIGLDPETATGEDLADLDTMAKAWAFGDRPEKRQRRGAGGADV